MVVETFFLGGYFRTTRSSIPAFIPRLPKYAVVASAVEWGTPYDNAFPLAMLISTNLARFVVRVVKMGEMMLRPEITGENYQSFLTSKAHLNCKCVWLSSSMNLETAS